ncbi:MAG: transposase [Endozoicomonadaceae bacterium]|nr:transposase [Endozoicomonadaceae bacterium]
MQKSFTTQPKRFVSATDLSHPILHSLDDTEALLDWSDIEKLLSSIYASKTGRPGYPLLTLFRALLLGTWYRLSDVQLTQCLYRDLLFRKFCHLELGDYGLARTRFMGLAKNATIFGLAAMAANIRKGTQFLLLYGVPKICSAG